MPIPSRVEPPADHLNEVWYSAKMDQWSGVTENPWPAGSSQALVWDLSRKAEAELEAWEDSLEVEVEKQVAAQDAWERRRADTPAGTPTPDRLARLVQSRSSRLLDYLAWDFAPSVLVNMERGALLGLAHKLASLPTRYERSQGIAPEPTPYGTDDH